MDPLPDDHDKLRPVVLPDAQPAAQSVQSGRLQVGQAPLPHVAELNQAREALERARLAVDAQRDDLARARQAALDEIRSALAARRQERREEIEWLSAPECAALIKLVVELGREKFEPGVSWDRKNLEPANTRLTSG
jgi:hypothetical protein